MNPLLRGVLIAAALVALLAALAALIARHLATKLLRSMP